MTRPHSPPPTVLVVDDEATVLALLAAALGRAGFAVRTAGGGEAAVEAYRRGGIDLVLLDVRMPAPWNGPATLRALQAVRPDVRAAFMSGDTGGYTADELRAAGAARVFAKPFLCLVELAAALRAMTPASAARPPAGSAPPASFDVPR